MAEAQTSAIVWKQLFRSTQLSEDIQAVYDDASIESIAELLHEPPDGTEIRTFVERAVRAYLRQRQIDSVGRPAKLETMRLIRAAKAAEKLADALKPLQTYGNCAAKITHFAKERLQDQDRDGAMTLSKLVENSGPGLLVEQLHELINGLADDLALATQLTRGEEIQNRRAYSLEIHEDEMKMPWNRNSRVRDSRCFDAAIHEIEPLWRAFGNGLFTEGKYHKEIGKTDSKLADLVQIILGAVDPKVTRQRATNGNPPRK
tara:strand:+ start:594 stop:1373 length:780 start_codon:yes stop_codon:yes gene_type:complete